jgi:DNA helicase-2/ATP-dependent DNA helicase PcrA
MVNTFHGFGVSVLQEDSNVVQYPKSFLVLDNSDIDAMLALVYEHRGLTLRDMTFSQARDMIEVQKLFKHPGYYRDLISVSLDDVQRNYDSAATVEDIIFYGYLYQQKKCFGLDYNDLIKFTLHIFSTSDEVRLKWQQRIEYLMIDEFQDIDGLQYELMEVLCGFHGNLFVVGDPDQTIYTWRGADVKYLLNFDENHLNTKTVMMNDNFRSTPQLVAVANSLISKNKARMEKSLVSQRPDGLKPLCHHAKNAAEEAEWIAEQVQCLHA